jgi:hypothetical protein
MISWTSCEAPSIGTSHAGNCRQHDARLNSEMKGEEAEQVSLFPQTRCSLDSQRGSRLVSFRMPEILRAKPQVFFERHVSGFRRGAGILLVPPILVRHRCLRPLPPPVRWKLICCHNFWRESTRLSPSVRKLTEVLFSNGASHTVLLIPLIAGFSRLKLNSIGSHPPLPDAHASTQNVRQGRPLR